MARIDLRKNAASIASVMSGLLLVYVNFILFSGYPQLFSIINLMSGLLIIGIPLVVKYQG